MITDNGINDRIAEMEFLEVQEATATEIENLLKSRKNFYLQSSEVPSETVTITNTKKPTSISDRYDSYYIVTRVRDNVVIYVDIYLTADGVLKHINGNWDRDVEILTVTQIPNTNTLDI